jgi:hypothetical protein
MHMKTPRWHHLALAFAGLLLAYPRLAHAIVYQFTIEESRGAAAVGTGDAARSQALRFANGDIVVSVPLNTLAVPWISGNLRDPGYLDIYAPPPGVMLTAATRQYYAEMGGAPPAPFCTGTGPGCVVPLGYAYVSWVSLPVDIWGHFEGDAWVPNPDPGAHSFIALAPPGSDVPSPGMFSMRPLIPEPPVAFLFGVGLAVLLARGRRKDALCSS